MKNKPLSHALKNTSHLKAALMEMLKYEEDKLNNEIDDLKEPKRKLVKII